MIQPFIFHETGFQSAKNNLVLFSHLNIYNFSG